MMSNPSASYKEYGYNDTMACFTASYLLPTIFELVGEVGSTTRILDIGCGNGYIAGQLARRGCTVVGIDLSQSGIALARQAYPQVRFEVLAANAEVLLRLNEAPFDLVISTEVVEHLYDPRSYAAGCYAALREDGGRFICSTPYHGYLKNLALSVAGKWDSHASPLWDGGHIKLWSRNSLSRLLIEAGFDNLQFRGVGRLPWMWKSMIMSGDKTKILA